MDNLSKKISLIINSIIIIFLLFNSFANLSRLLRIQHIFTQMLMHLSCTPSSPACKALTQLTCSPIFHLYKNKKNVGEDFVSLFQLTGNRFRRVCGEAVLCTPLLPSDTPHELTETVKGGFNLMLPPRSTVLLVTLLLLTALSSLNTMVPRSPHVNRPPKIITPRSLPPVITDLTRLFQYLTLTLFRVRVHLCLAHPI